jgi:RNA polymerase sigma factor (sigma-70 family)
MEKLKGTILESIEEFLAEIKNQAAPSVNLPQFRLMLEANHARGRIQLFTSGDPERVRAYLTTILANYIQHSKYVYQVQTSKEEAVWLELYRKINFWAYSLLLRYNWTPGAGTSETAQELAQQAAIVVMTAHFPYDTEFDSWARVITSNVVMKFFRKGKNPANPSNTSDLDELAPRLVDPDGQDEEELSGLRMDLLDAIEQLSDNRREVIMLTYFSGLNGSQIANKMDKSEGAVYALRHHALAELSKILGTYRDNYE